jgi:YfiR/HmsC-like
MFLDLAFTWAKGLAGALIVLVTITVSAFGFESPEYTIKAAYLYKFVPFVEWPSPPGSSFDICIIGDDPFGSAIDRAVDGQTAMGKPIEVTRLDDSDSADQCQILFIAPSEGRSVRAIADKLEGRPILTVADEGDSDTDTVITFVIEDNRVRFEINDDIAAKDGLTISSKLLSLATDLQPRQRT